MKINKIKSYQFGVIAEFLAIIFLYLKGYKIIARRYKTHLGEIDIIATKSNFLIAVEVKARKNINIKNGFLIDEVLTIKQRERIKRALNSFIQRHYQKYHQHNIRLDLIVVSHYKMPVHFINFWQ